MDRQVVRDEMEQARQTFHRLLDSATVGELSRPSNGTKWTNGQLLFHMLFGYLIVVRLMVLVRIFGRLPDGVSRAFARALEASTRPFHVINYIGSVGGPKLACPRAGPGVRPGRGHAVATPPEPGGRCAGGGGDSPP